MLWVIILKVPQNFLSDFEDNESVTQHSNKQTKKLICNFKKQLDIGAVNSIYHISVIANVYHSRNVIFTSPCLQRASKQKHRKQLSIMKAIHLLVFISSSWVWLNLAAIKCRVPHAPIVTTHVNFCSQTTGLTKLASFFHFFPHLQILLHSYKMRVILQFT